MAELTPQERLQPALLDRLIDEHPQDRTKELREQRLINRMRLRQAVLRDLEWLFNCARPSDREGLAAYPFASRSVLNYGLPSLSGQSASSMDVVDLERGIRQAILDFEPRIIGSTLEVTPIASESALDHHNILSIEIRGMLWAEPVPIEMLVRTDVDLESGAVTLNELRGG